MREVYEGMFLHKLDSLVPYEVTHIDNGSDILVTLREIGSDKTKTQKWSILQRNYTEITNLRDYLPVLLDEADKLLSASRDITRLVLQPQSTPKPTSIILPPTSVIEVK